LAGHSTRAEPAGPGGVLPESPLVIRRWAMPRAFTVDRLQTLVAGQVIERTRHQDLDPPELQAHVDELFPEGVTQHGDHYFLQGSRLATLASPNIELIYEYVRRANFPGRPSRFEAAFGCEDQATAEAFRANPNWGAPGAPIWEVEVDEDPFRADMACLTLEGISILVVSYAAHRYWSGLPNVTTLRTTSISPSWELLLRPPVRVLRRVA
jgi:hypothetical protein